jgi:acetylornithine deacetylase/succinyl-diaminopimelate desuccinylase-like protein
MRSVAAGLLQELIRFDTVNPPGNERACQEHLAARFRDAGFDEVTLVGKTPERPNLVARLKGRAPGPVLCLLSHVDTVLATPEDWTTAHGPWSGDLDDDGLIWGRGAQDMKSQTAAEAAAAIALAGDGWRPAQGDLIVVSVVDEEVGGYQGAVWLCENHPELVRCDYLLNEGGGTVIPYDGKRLYGVCCAEKGVFRFELHTRGTAGHASMPNIGDNALLKLAPLVQRLGGPPIAWDVTEAPRTLLGALGFDGDDAGAALDALRERDPVLAAFVQPMLAVTFAPTRIWASEKINVIPAVARLQVDCRVPPGLGRDVALTRAQGQLGNDAGEYELSFIEEVVGNGSRVDSPLMDAIASFIGAEDPAAMVVPTMLPAYTDSRIFRDHFPDVVAYGFFPQREFTLYEAWPLVHGKDERIHAKDVEYAAQAYAQIAKELLG